MNLNFRTSYTIVNIEKQSIQGNLHSPPSGITFCFLHAILILSRFLKKKPHNFFDKID